MRFLANLLSHAVIIKYLKSIKFNTVFNHVKWAMKDKCHLDILMAAICVSNLFQNITYNIQTFHNETKTEKYTF